MVSGPMDEKGGRIMSKEEMIEAIRRQNRTASRDFLDEFDDRQLSSYLRRLTTVRNRRGPGSAWVREGDTPAISGRTSIPGL